MSENTASTASVEDTATLARLFETDREQRDDAWIAQFLTAMPNAAMKASEERVFNGPDGFLYFGLYMPQEGETFNAISLSGVTEFCSKEGLGVAVFQSGKNEPEWVFNYGSIWNFLKYGSFYENPFAEKLKAPEEEDADERRSESVLVAAPSEEFLPLFVRAVLLRDLDQQNVENPSMLMMTVPNETSYLVFNVFPEDFEEEHFEFLQQYLMWALPQGYSIASVPAVSELSEHFVSIRDMLESPLN